MEHSFRIAIVLIGLCFAQLWNVTVQVGTDGHSTLPTTVEEMSQSTDLPFTTHPEPMNSSDESLTVAPIVWSREALKDAERDLLNYVNSLLRQLLPHVMKSGSTSLSPRCMSAMVMSFSGFKRLSGWTLKLLDSIAKPEAGMMTGRPFSFGDYDQCLAISVAKRGDEATRAKDELFRGKYCKILLQQNPIIVEAARKYHDGEINKTELGKLKEMIESAPYLPVSKDYMTHRIGICMPSFCNEEDVSGIVQTFPFPGVISVESCETRSDTALNLQQRAFIVVFGVLLFLVAISSVTDKLLQMYPEEDAVHHIKKKCVNIVISFSICSNTKKLFRKVQNDCEEAPDWRVIRGLTVAAVVGLIFYHTYLPPFDEFFRQSSYLKNLENYFERPSFSVIVGLPMVIEILFFTCGFSISNRIWKSTWINKVVELNVLKVALFSYFRLCAPLLFCTGFVLLLPALGSGPFWNNVFSQNVLDNCRQNWWSVVAMYSNFLDLEEQCFPHFWIGPCLLQIILFSLVFMLVLSRWPKFGCFMTVLVSMGCCIAVGLSTLKNKLPPAYVDYFADRKTNAQWKVQQSLPLVHVVSFSFGMLLGIGMARKANVRMNRFFVLLCWIACLGLAAGLCEFLRHFYIEKNDYTLGSAAYAGLHVLVFSIIMAWIVWACGYGYGGFVGSILKWSVLDPLYKLSYFAYLFHLIIIAFHCGIAREHFHYSHVEAIFRGTSYVVLSYIAAYIAQMILIMPMKSLYAAICSSQSQIMTITSPSRNDCKNNNYENYFKGVA